MSNKRPVLILVGDSRLHGFDRFRYENFRFRSVIKSGAVVETLIEETLSVLREYKDTNRSIIVKIACGINEFTKFDYHNYGKDLRLRSNVSYRTVLDKLKQFKDTIKREVPTAVVGFVTIPTLSFVNYREHISQKYKEERRRQTKESKHKGRKSERYRKSNVTDEELQKDQETLDNELLCLNTSLKLENSRKQRGLLKGCYTISWHNSISKESRRKRRSGTRKVIRNNFSELYDGLHPSRSLKVRWHKQLLKVANSELELIKQYNLKSTKVTFTCKT